MAQLPPVSNVFGYLHSNVGLQPIAFTLRSRLGLTATQVWVTRSSFDGTETLRMETLTCRLETRTAQSPDMWLFNGAVAGAPDEICESLLPIVQNLRWSGFSATFEIYDDTFQLVAECPRGGEVK